MDPNSELFRAKQQVIYYKAEIAQYKNKIGEFERLVEKEVVRNKYLQAKVRELNGEKIARLQEEIQKLRKRVMELEVELEEENNGNGTVLQETTFPVREAKEHFYSYFNYSVILPSEGEDTLSVYGDFTIVNNGQTPLEDFIVCIKVKPVGAVLLSGKIMDQKLLDRTGSAKEETEWVWAVENWRMKVLEYGEYWIKPIRKGNLNTQKLSLNNFEVTIQKEEVFKKSTIEGTVFINEHDLTVRSTNKIIFI
ncbi:MAG: hypothetical protein U9Q88_18710 [Bacillota bacterium]|nr:hypothetical protein [Bacillota bacterium]